MFRQTAESDRVSPEPRLQPGRLFPQEPWTMRSSLLVGFCAAFLSGAVLAQQPAPATPQAAAVAGAPKLTDAQMEDFLLHAKVIKTRSAKKGVTGSRRATLTEGTLTHDAHVQDIDDHQQQFTGSGGT